MNKILISKEQFNCIINEAVGGIDQKIKDAITNNHVVWMQYNYNHRPDDKNQRLIKVVRPFVIGRSRGKGEKQMVRCFEYDKFYMPSDKFKSDEDGVRLRFNTDDDNNKGKNFPTYTTTTSKKWKTYFVEQINFWQVLGTDDIDIPEEFKPDYVQNDKLFKSITLQKK